MSTLILKIIVDSHKKFAEKAFSKLALSFWQMHQMTLKATPFITVRPIILSELSISHVKFKSWLANFYYRNFGLEKNILRGGF